MYYEVSEDLARRAWDAVHMGDYNQNSAFANSPENYRAAVDAAQELAEAQKTNVSTFYHARIDSLFDSYSRRLAKWYNDYNRNAAAYPSQFICGAGNYNMRKHNAQMNRESTLWEERKEIDAILHKIETAGTGPVDLADPNAREMLLEQIDSHQKTLDACKTRNAYYRKHKTFVGCPDFTDAEAAEADKSFAELRARAPFVDKPYPDYELTSLRGKIKRLTARLEELDRRQEAAENPAENQTFDGGEIVRNTELDRLQIIFQDIPDEATRAALKSNGFRWSPRNKAWQRQLTENAERAARRVLNI